LHQCVDASQERTHSVPRFEADLHFERIARRQHENDSLSRLLTAQVQLGGDHFHTEIWTTASPVLFFFFFSCLWLFFFAHIFPSTIFRAKSIKNVVTINKQRSIAELNAIIEKLNAELKTMKKYCSVLELELAGFKGSDWNVNDFRKKANLQSFSSHSFLD
jgi:hypothetical protein